MNNTIEVFRRWFDGLIAGDAGSLAIAAGVGAVVVLLVIRVVLRKRRNATSTHGQRGLSSAQVSTPETGGAFGALTPALASQLPESEKESRDFKQLLRQAGLYSPTARISVYAMRFVLLFVPLVTAGLIALSSPARFGIRIMIVGALIAGALSIIPRFWVLLRRGRRIHEIRTGLADMMDMLSMCLGGGMPLSPSLEHVAQNLSSYPALADELSILRRQAEVGSLKLALVDFANRIDIPEVRQVASLLSRGEQLGTQLSSSLHDQADHFRSTRRQVATMHSNRMPVFLTFPLMFCFAPAVLIMLMSPALLELTDFLNPNGSPNALRNNNLSPAQISRTLDELDQDISPAN